MCHVDWVRRVCIDIGVGEKESAPQVFMLYLISIVALARGIFKLGWVLFCFFFVLFFFLAGSLGREGVWLWGCNLGGRKKRALDTWCGCTRWKAPGSNAV